MASAAHTTGASVGAPKSETSLCQFETVHGSLEHLAAVLAAAGEEVTNDGMSQRGILLLYAAEDVLERAIWRMSGAVSAAHREGWR